MIQQLKNLSLKNKIFFSTTAVIILISVLIALFTRWVVISSLTNELQRRGLGIAQSIAEGSRSYILTENIPELVSLLFEGRLGERKQLTTYVYILDKDDILLSHTFVEPFPSQLIDANPLPAEATQSITLLTLDAKAVYDIAVPVKEGIYRIGTVHLGLNKSHIDQLIAKLRSTFVGFVSVVTVFFFYISHTLVRYITRPISELIRITEDISSGEALMAAGSSYTPPNVTAEDGPLAPPGAAVPAIKDEVQQLKASYIQITRRIRQSQMQLKESEEKYRSLFAGGPNPIFVVDRDTLSILDANPSAEETYGFSWQELVGRLFTDLGPLPVEGLPVTDGIAAGDGHQYRMVSAKVQYFRKNRTPLFVNVHASPTRYQGREAIIVATTDITEMVEKDSQLIQASKMTTLGEMSAGIAHELNQPLNAIKMGSEYLEMVTENRDRLTTEDLVEVVREISAQVDRAAGIIIRLRDFGRKADFARDRICINRPIQSVIEIVGKQLQLQNIQLRMDLAPALPSIFAHHNRLEQVIFNLVTNSRDAIMQKQEAGIGDGVQEITIRSSAEDHQVVVTVSDTGIGIPEGLRKSIFEAFFTTKQMGEGMGLGLSITNGIVRDYGGRIEVTSEEGRGATFRLVFPAAG